MSYKDIFEENKNASLQNLQWLGDRDTFDAEESDQGLNSKPELELQWGNNDIHIMDEFAQKEHYAEKDDTPKEIAASVRMRMMMGKRYNQAVQEVIQNYGEDAVLKAKSQIVASKDLDGAVGHFLIDPSVLPNCGNGIRMSGDQRFMKYALAYDKCDDCCYCKVIQASYSSGKDGSIDSALASEEFGSVDTGERRCLLLSKKLIAGYQDIDDEDMDQDMIDLMTVGSISEEEVEKINASCSFDALRKAHIKMNKKENREYKEYGYEQDLARMAVPKKTTVELDDELDPSLGMSDEELVDTAVPSSISIELDDKIESSLEVSCGETPVGPLGIVENDIEFDIDEPLEELDVDMRATLDFS